jgi:tripartite-type tricarboxylate transporter receptor subunit TctC
MIKKLVVIAALAVASLAQARETINIVWGFNIGSNQANTVRIMCEELNAAQDKYTFVLAHRPGAGGTIAANAVASNPANTLVSMSSSFIIRPLFEKTEPTHNLDNYVPILVQGTGSPLYVVSGKYTSMKQVLTTPNVSIGISGNGNISHMVAAEIAGINKTANIVLFKNMIESGTAAAGGHVDVAIGLYTDVKPFLDSNKVEVLAYTGRVDMLNNKNMLLTRFNMPEARDITANYAIFASRDMPRERFLELHKLLSWAQLRAPVVDSLLRDQLNISTMSLDQAQAWYSNERIFWKKQVESVNKVK